MKWFDEWFYRKVRWAWKRGGIENPDWKRHEDYLDSVAEEAEYETKDALQPGFRLIEDDPHRLLDSLTINVKKLQGGFIVTFRHPLDRDCHHVEEAKQNSYIIQEDEDFNERLGKLLTMELLK